MTIYCPVCGLTLVRIPGDPRKPRDRSLLVCLVVHEPADQEQPAAVELEAADA